MDFEAPPYEDSLQRLLKTLTPRNPIRDLSDQQVFVHRQTGELIGFAILHVLGNEKGTGNQFWMLTVSGKELNNKFSLRYDKVVFWFFPDKK